ncbi:MAG: AraC family transcriptional regulator [Polyangiaceae bacterium]
MAAPLLRDLLKIDRAVNSDVRLRHWVRDGDDAARFSPAAHDALELSVIHEGHVAFDAGGEEIVAGPGECVLVPIGVSHRTSFLSSMRGTAVWLGPELVRELADALGSRAGLPHALFKWPASEGRLRRLLSLLHEEIEQGDLGHERATSALTESVIIEMLRGAPSSASLAPPRSHDPRVALAIAHMHEAIAGPLSVDDLARAARMSRFHFSRLFREETGQAPYQYLLRLRISRAEALLRAGGSTVTEAALATGFTDFSRFASTFRKHTGKRPTEVLKTARFA